MLDADLHLLAGDGDHVDGEAVVRLGVLEPLGHLGCQMGVIFYIKT